MNFWVQTLLSYLASNFLRIVKWLVCGVFIVSSGLDAETTRLKLTIENVQHAQGHIIIALFTCQSSYDKAEAPIISHLLPAKPEEGKMQYTFENLVAGVYAIKLFHDINDNQKLDANWLGIPREPFGFSNNPRIRFGPPSFEAAQFEVIVNATTSAVISLRSVD
jgi:uncharacterized protein (DUF2141 family)